MVVQFKAKQNEIAKLAKINKSRVNELIVDTAAKKLSVFFAGCHYTVSNGSVVDRGE